jgi:NAD(P)-dependent dehydrogenase (short-subunit alcohol dehydrogenase family)
MMNVFDMRGKNTAVLGGGGILGTALACGLAEAGANVAVCDLNEKKAQRTADLVREKGVRSSAYVLDAMERESLERVCKTVFAEYGHVHVLVNAVGGNMKQATTSEEVTYFDLPPETLDRVVRLNLMAGAMFPSQVFGKKMACSPEGGAIINISSMNYYRPLTRTPGYSAAKAAVSNFTQWLAVYLAQEYGEKIRVNAIAPGFFLTDQNRYLLTDAESGELTDRGRRIIEHTPQGRFGEPSDLIGTLIWLASDASRFVTGITVPVDGGFSAYSGV